MTTICGLGVFPRHPTLLDKEDLVSGGQCNSCARRENVAYENFAAFLF
jgi:hypothetical protein